MTFDGPDVLLIGGCVIFLGTLLVLNPLLLLTALGLAMMIAGLLLGKKRDSRPEA
jgi:hypothetical protein